MATTTDAVVVEAVATPAEGAEVVVVVAVVVAEISAGFYG